MPAPRRSDIGLTPRRALLTLAALGMGGALAGGGGPLTLAPPLPQRPVRELRLAAAPNGDLVLATLTDDNGYDSNRGTFTARDVRVFRESKGAWQPLGGLLNYDRPRPASSLALDAAGNPVLAWVEERGSLGRVRLSRWTGRGWRDEGIQNLDPARDARSPAVVVRPDATVVLAWREDVDGRYRVHLRQLRP